MNTSVIAIIGAGEAAIPIINKIKELGIKSLAFGRNDSIAKDMVDVFIEENSFDIQYMAQKCREYCVNGVIASSEMTTEAAAYLAYELGLPGNSVDGGFAGKNKYEMRKRVANVKSICQPNFELYKKGEEYSFPIIVKAVDACGKRGVSLVKREEDFENAIMLATENSSNGAVLIEEYLEGGKEYSIECLSIGHIHQIIQYTEKDSSGPPHFVELGHHQPANLSNEIKEEIKIAVSDVLDVLGLNCGMAHFEMKIIDNKLYFIEVGARGGGDHISDILTPLSTGFDYFKAAVLCALGKYSPQEIGNKAYTGIYFHCKQNEHLQPLFEKAKTAEWCVKNTVKTKEFCEASGNVETSGSGYIIYCSDHKL